MTSTPSCILPNTKYTDSNSSQCSNENHGVKLAKTHEKPNLDFSLNVLLRNERPARVVTELNNGKSEQSIIKGLLIFHLFSYKMPWDQRSPRMTWCQHSNVYSKTARLK